MIARGAARDREREFGRKGVDDDEGEGGTSLISARHDSKDAGDGQQSRSYAASGSAQTSIKQEQGQLQDAVLRNQHAFSQNTHVLPTIGTAVPPTSHPPLADRSSRHVTPTSAGLHIQTNVEGSLSTAAPAKLKQTPTINETPVFTEPTLHTSLTSPVQIPGTAGSGLRNTLSTASLASSFSPGTSMPSPYLAAMSDLTPLPSPMASDSPGPWRRAQLEPPPRSRQSSLDDGTQPMRARTASLPVSPGSPPKRKKAYGSLAQEVTLANAAAHDENAQQSRAASEVKRHGRNRSVSDFIPEALHNTRHRHVTFGAGDAQSFEAQAQSQHMQREANLAERRGLTGAVVDTSTGVPTPPASSSGVDEKEEAAEPITYLEDGTQAEYLEIHCGIHNKRRKFRQLRQLGHGTFSRVMLATHQPSIPTHLTPEIEDHLDPHKLVAVKIVEHGPAGGADEERIETGLKREVEMLKSVSHPSLVHLKACEYQPSRALLVLTYCPGGDLFELASANRALLTPPLVQRIFAELLSAVTYLHTNSIVHRDLKLENVLVNLPPSALQALSDPRTHPFPLITLTDLGLSRRIPSPPASPLLTTRCGSEDYAAPEILLGQPYDGRKTDAWALGVLLYALVEGRLPFDVPPGKPERSRTSHRIARCEWIWSRCGDADGEWDPSRAPKGLEGAREVVEGLLRKVRMGRVGLAAVAEGEWVRGGVSVEGGLRVEVVDDDFYV